MTIGLMTLSLRLCVTQQTTLGAVTQNMKKLNLRTLSIMAILHCDINIRKLGFTI